MAQITMAEISKLRTATSAGMMDCKKALEEADGDFDKAIEIIRKKGQLVASKRADRAASEGCVLAGTSADGKYGCVVSLNCETDFVAKNADFVNLTQSILATAINNKPANLEALLATSLEGRTVADLITDRVGATGEKMELGYYDFVTGEKVIAYIHPGNKLATVVSFNEVIDDQTGRDVAMQVAAMNPVAVDKNDVPAEVLQQEKDIAIEQIRREGKPEEMVEKIAMGKLAKFFKENTLLNQEFVKDNKMDIRSYLQSKSKSLTVNSFKRFTLNS